jgi:hypothetical protein
MALPRVLFMGQDLYALGYVSKLPDIIERKTFSGNLSTINSFTFECDNIDNFFSNGELASSDWLYEGIQAYNSDNVLIWDGVVNDLRRNHRNKKAYLETKDIMFQYRKRNISYESSTWETTAAAAKAIMDAESFTAYDNGVIERSNTVLDNASCNIKANFNESDNIDMFSALKLLANYSGAYYYQKNNNVFFQQWEAYSGGASIEFNYDVKEQRPLTAPVVSHLEKELVNDYTLSYFDDNGTPITDATGNDIGAVSREKYLTQSLENIRSGNESQLIYENSTSAIFAGESHIRRTHFDLDKLARALIKIQFDVDIEYRQFIELGTIFYLTFDEEQCRKLFEVFEFRRNEDRRNINIVAQEVV